MDKLRFEEQFSKIKSKPVQLQSMYALVKDYLSAMAYSDTLHVLENEYGTSADNDSPTFIPKQSLEETKLSPGLKRKMTIDYGQAGDDSKQNKDAESVNNINDDDDDDNSRSQLTIETEKMMPLAAVDCLLSKSASIASSSQVAVTTTG